MADFPLGPSPSRRLPYARHRASPSRPVHGDPLAATFRLFTGPAAAFLMAFPTIGYYTLAAYVNVIMPEGSLGAILIRAASFALLVLAWLQTPAALRRRYHGLLVPATIFICLYSWRLLENMLLQGMEISPGNAMVLLTFFVSSLVPAYMLASVERSIRDDEMIRLLSIFAVLFVIGMALNRETLMAAAENRMLLDKINPISLAYVASSLMMFYLLAFARSKRMMIEALAVVPILLLIVSLARSRGMMISTGATLLIYISALRGSRRIWVLIGLSTVAAIIGFYVNPEYVGYATEALNRIDVDRDISTAMRALSFYGAWEQFLADPWFGRYAIELVTAFYPHNIYLEALMSVGLIGTIPFLVHLFMAGRATIGILREKERSFTRLFVALLFIRDAIGSAASGAIWGASGFWITSFLVIVMWYGRKRDQRYLAIHSRKHHILTTWPPLQLKNCATSP